MSDFEYAPAPESKAIANIKKDYGLYINGKFVASHNKKRFETINPANEEVLAKISLADEVDIDKAVKAARSAYVKVWSKLSGKERAKYLFRIARLLQERSREFAVVETLDNGKPIRKLEISIFHSLPHTFSITLDGQISWSLLALEINLKLME